MSFDPNAAAAADSGVFGLTSSAEEAGVVLVPVPFDATTSYRAGAAWGPEAILEASRQVDLFDVETGRPYEVGIHMLPVPEEVKRWNRAARHLAEPVIAAGGVGGSPALRDAAARVAVFGEEVNAWVQQQVETHLARGKLVGVVGGDHSTPFGAIAAVAAAHPGVGILHIDAHADLRRAYEGFTWSHASIMYNVMERIPGIPRLVQVGIRDLCEEEMDYIRASHGRIVTHFDVLLAAERFEGVSWAEQVRRIIQELPREVYVSFDIDGLDPALCPHTGTPVAGGLSFHQMAYLLRALVEHGRHIVGFDLNEVAPGKDGDDWDANVGARVLYKLIGWAVKSGGGAVR